jgi:hypothetical protein
LAFHILSLIYGKRLSSRETEAEVSRHSEPETRLCEPKDAEKGGSDQQNTVKGIERWRRRGSLLKGPMNPRLVWTLQYGRWDQNNRQSRGGNGESLCGRRKGQRLGGLYVVALAALGRGLAGHRMLAVSLAAVLCPCDITDSFLEASKARPGQKRAKRQDRDTCYPEAMSLVLLHSAM